MPERRWFYCTACGELFDWAPERTGPPRCPTGCPPEKIRPARRSGESLSPPAGARPK